MKILGLAVITLVLALGARAGNAPEKTTPAQQKIAWAQAAIKKNPAQHQPYNDLALAFAKRARETSDVNYYAQAEAALAQSFELAPANLEGQKVQAWVLLGQHEFTKALELAKTLNQRTPDDVLIYGFLVDANVELGNYKEAEEAAQWMLDIRPGNVPGLTRAAYLRELFGDMEGALELMHAAYQQTPPQEVEDRAWILTHMAHLRLTTGNVNGAETLLQQALALFPGYHYALGNLSTLRTMQHNYSEAVHLLRQRYQAAPHPENLYLLAEALEREGKTQEAKSAFADFEERGRREIDWADNANRELILYYTDHAHKPAEALRIARLEIARRHDVHTLDAYAWALYANRLYSEARKEIQTALAAGTRDAKMLYHAGAIAARLRDRTSAASYLVQSLELNPLSEVSGGAREELEKLPKVFVARAQRASYQPPAPRR